MSWNYRITTRRTMKGEVAYEIREVYYSDDGKIGYSVDAMAPFGETRAELEANMAQMMSCLTEPVLDLDTGEWIA